MARKLLWTDGLELRQHIFELADAYHEDLLAERFAAIDYAWGIERIEWNKLELSSGRLVIERLSAILPDGTPIACGSPEHAERLTRMLHADLADSVDVYLGIPRRRARNEDPDGEGEPLPHDRYVKASRHVTELVSGRPLRVDWLRPNVSILLQGEELDDHDVIPCAQIVRGEADRFRFEETFIPPVLSVRASPYLVTRLHKLHDALVDCRKDLTHMPVRDAADAARRSVVAFISAGILLISDLLQQPHPHPLSMYRSLAQLLGQISAYGGLGHVDIAAFQFERLASTFDPLFENIFALLESLGTKAYRRIPLQLVKDGKFRADLREATIFRNDFYLGIVGDEADADVLRSRIPNEFTIAAWSQLEQFMHSAVRGVHLIPEARTPLKLPDTPGSVYFRLEKNDAFKAIFKTGALGLFRRPLSRVSDVILYAVEPTNGSGVA